MAAGKGDFGAMIRDVAEGEGVFLGVGCSSACNSETVRDRHVVTTAIRY